LSEEEIAFIENKINQWSKKKQGKKINNEQHKII